MKVDCDKCGREIEKKASLVFAPPRKRKNQIGDNTVKYHICNLCWPILLSWMEAGRTSRKETMTYARYKCKR